MPWWSAGAQFVQFGVAKNPLSVQYIKGVGPKRAELLGRLGIETADELLRYYPRDWQDRRAGTLLSLFRQDSYSVFRGRVLTAGQIYTRSSVGIFKALLSGADGAQVNAVWFKHGGLRYDPFATLKKEFTPERDVWVIGRPSNTSGSEIQVDECYFADNPESAPHVNRLTPIYPLTEGLSNPFLRSIMWKALDAAQKTGTVEIIPPSLLAKRALLSAGQAVKGIHFPDSAAELEAARQRIVYEEFLLLAAAWEMKRLGAKTENKRFTYEIKRSLLTPFKEKLGFEFTPPQKRVINEIFNDMRAPRPMTRLLQGDVGSGKTVVALSALLLAAENGFQGAFMAPTEILAAQHFYTMSRFLDGLKVRFELLTSKVKAAARRKTLERLQNGELDIVVGTHALLEEDVRFKSLRLVVIDEQHRFGVKQRAQLRRKAEFADLLIMTATPIPRTLALALYGDLDVSTIDSLPPGRQPVETARSGEAEAFQLVREEARKGRQAYVVHPFIEESEDEDIKSVSEQFERLSKTVFPEFRVGMIHGKLGGREKSAAMEKFVSGETQILVATPVIEVGIDVKNATVMVVQNAERFGLASLHQLRGRVGRGAEKSHCVLVSDSPGATASERLAALCATNDGFVLGEKDMELRGPGEFMGTRQHGELDLRAGDLVADKKVLDWAVEDRERLFAADPKLAAPQHRAFRGRLMELYSKKWHLIDMA